jgi:hypothetical protein
LNPRPACHKSESAQGLAEQQENPLAHSLACESQESPAEAPSTRPPADPPDADLARLMSLWPALPEAGRRLLVTTAEMLVG